MKLKEKEECRKLRQQGLSLNDIAKSVKVSKSSVSLWVRDIDLTNEQREKLQLRDKSYIKYSENFRNKRREYQAQGREKIHNEDKGYAFGCALFWGEGTKCKNYVRLTNSDIKMISYFVKFLRKYFNVQDNDFSITFQYYLNNNLTLEDIQSYWCNQLKLPVSCLRKCTLKSKYYDNTKVKHPYGICTVSINNTRIAQQIFGSIKEFVKDNSDKWLF